MNMNVKLDGEDEQSVQFPNTATIALQSGPAAYINLNIVNPNLGNSAYILNPVNTVPQNLVAYQSPVALQSYITLQEADGNIVNNLQVGVPVPAALLQNPNLMNTSIIIGNEEQPVILKPATNSIPNPNDIKISYMPKPVVQEIKQAVVQEDPNMRWNDMTGISLDNALKKPCPLEMSIKAANIDLDFEKCDPDSSMNGLLHQENYPIMPKLPSQTQMTDNMVLNVPVKLNVKMDVPVIRQDSNEVKKPKTEITWENHSQQNQATSDEFHESLICEVEEEDEDDGKSADSSNDNETLPLSLVVKLRRVQEDRNEGKDGKMKKLKESAKMSNKNSAVQKNAQSKQFVKVRKCCTRKECFKKITPKDQKTVFKNFYDLVSSSKQDNYLINCMEHVQTSRSLEGESNAKSAEHDDKTIFESPNIQLEIENESNGNQMLSDEIQKAIKESLKDCMANQVNREEEEDDDGEDDDDDDDDGEEEDEEDSFEKRTSDDDSSENSDSDEDDKSQNWNYYIVIDRCRKKVCLKFLLKLLRITKKRIKSVQAKILSGQSLSDDSSSFATNGETFDVWDFARIHLNTLASEKHPYCKSNPPHRFLVNESSIEHLYDTFRDFYMERAKKELSANISAYKRFLQNDTKFSLSGMKPGSCSECDILEEDDRRKGKKGVKNAAVYDSIAKLDRSFQTRKKGRKKWDISTDTDCSSDDEPLVKRKKLLTLSTRRGTRVQNADSGKKLKSKLKKDTKTKGNGVRGRDVWSLMLLHLETMPYKICKSCVSRKRHRFFDASMTKQALYEDYRRYFLKETNSELGLGFTMYEKYFDRNCGFTIGDVDVNSPVCPRCALEPPKPESNKSNKKSSKNSNNNFRFARHGETIS